MGEGGLDDVEPGFCDPVAPTADLAELATYWAQWMVPDYACPLLAPTAPPADFGASGRPCGAVASRTGRSI